MSNQTEGLFKKLLKWNKNQRNRKKTVMKLFFFGRCVQNRVTFKFRSCEKIVLFNSELNLRFTMTDQNLTMSNNQFAKPMDWIKKILKEYLKNEKNWLFMFVSEIEIHSNFASRVFLLFLTGTDQILMEFCLESWSHQRFSIFWQLYSFERWTNPPFQTLQ